MVRVQEVLRFPEIFKCNENTMVLSFELKEIYNVYYIQTLFMQIIPLKDSKLWEKHVLSESAMSWFINLYNKNCPDFLYGVLDFSI